MWPQVCLCVLQWLFSNLVVDILGKGGGQDEEGVLSGLISWTPEAAEGYQWAKQPVVLAVAEAKA